MSRQTIITELDSDKVYRGAGPDDRYVVDTGIEFGSTGWEGEFFKTLPEAKKYAGPDAKFWEDHSQEWRVNNEVK